MTKPTILIGNGINHGFYDWIDKIKADQDKGSHKNEMDLLTIRRRFSYCEIIKQMNIENPSLNIPKKFQDIEKYLQTIHDSERKHKITSYFISALDNMHYCLYNDLKKLNKENKFDIFIKNIKQFSSIYTTNFDLKLYYLMKILNLFGNKSKGYKNRFNDCFYSYENGDNKYEGFSIHQFMNGRKNIPLNLHYLHGAMHLSCVDINHDKQGIFKLANVNGGNLCSWSQKISSITKISRALIIGATTKEKESKINQCEYFVNSLLSLKNINKDLIVYGCSLDPNDKHIWDNINSSDKLKSIYIGVDNLKNNEKIKNIFLNNKKVKLFNHRDINIWSDENFLAKVEKDSTSK